jgi:hypothetical protein
MALRSPLLLSARTLYPRRLARRRALNRVFLRSWSTLYPYLSIPIHTIDFYIRSSSALFNAPPVARRSGNVGTAHKGMGEYPPFAPQGSHSLRRDRSVPNLTRLLNAVPPMPVDVGAAHIPTGSPALQEDLAPIPVSIFSSSPTWLLMSVLYHWFSAYLRPSSKGPLVCDDGQHRHSIDQRNRLATIEDS